LRANSTTVAARFASISFCALPISAEVKISTGSPFSMRSRIIREGPNVTLVVVPKRWSNWAAISVMPFFRLPAP
jgi:hypothetical protein